MFVLYAVAVGLMVGFVLGGRPSGLANLRFRWALLAIAGFAAQVVLFSEFASERVGAAGPPLYVASTALVLIAVLRNVRTPGLPLVALGAFANLAAIVANGGFMPASRDALAAIGHAPASTYSNSAVLDAPALAPLTDIFALARWLPFTNIFSVGDVLIALGVGIAIVIAMRSTRHGGTVSDAGMPARGDGRPARSGTQSSAPVSKP
jgi:hypothetical protein